MPAALFVYLSVLVADVSARDNQDLLQSSLDAGVIDHDHQHHAAGHSRRSNGTNACTSAAEMGKGRWITKAECFDNSADPCVLGDASEIEQVRKFGLLVWKPDSCKLKLFGAGELGSCLAERHLLFAGDSVSEGLFNQMEQLLRRHQQSKDRVHFLRVDTLSELLKGGDRDIKEWLKSKPALGKDSVLILGDGAHFAVDTRFAENSKPGDNPFLSNVVHPVIASDYPGEEREVSLALKEPSEAMKTCLSKDTTAQNYAERCKLVPSDFWDSGTLKNAVEFSKAACKSDWAATVTQPYADWMESVQEHVKPVFDGTVLFRTVQINLGFDKRGSENCFKRTLNAIMRKKSVDFGHALLDIEQMSETRPETYVHVNTNHFFCAQNWGLGEPGKLLGPAEQCDDEEQTVFDNGEPNRMMLHMSLGAACAR